MMLYVWGQKNRNFFFLSFFSLFWHWPLVIVFYKAPFWPFPYALILISQLRSFRRPWRHCLNFPPIEETNDHHSNEGSLPFFRQLALLWLFVRRLLTYSLAYMHCTYLVGTLTFSLLSLFHFVLYFLFAQGCHWRALNALHGKITML